MLKFVAKVKLPTHNEGGFDHADVIKKSGKVYVAHTANDSVDVIDGGALQHVRTIGGCQEASGVLCAQEEEMVFGASRGAGEVLVIDSKMDQVIGEIRAGTRPNGLAWDMRRRHLLVADVADNTARIFEAESGKEVGSVKLAGRPRWCLYDRSADCFLVNVREPSGISVIGGENLLQKMFTPVAAGGAHGLELNERTHTAYVACDEGVIVQVDPYNGKESGKVRISGPPDVLWLNSKNDRLYCAMSAPGVIDVIDTKELRVVETVKTEDGAHTFTFDPQRRRLYSFFPRTCAAAVFDEV